MLDNLLSKVIAAGLAAGVFLLWWPAHLPSAGAQWLVLRGLAWTLAFEILVLSFVPFEPRWMDAVYIALLAIVVSFIATLYPALKATALRPVEGLRYE